MINSLVVEKSYPKFCAAMCKLTTYPPYSKSSFTLVETEDNIFHCKGLLTGNNYRCGYISKEGKPTPKLFKSFDNDPFKTICMVKKYIK